MTPPISKHHCTSSSSHQPDATASLLGAGYFVLKIPRDDFYSQDVVYHLDVKAQVRHFVGCERHIVIVEEYPTTTTYCIQF
jgi:hypothetical protein